jgi:GMP synthase (glutamine-hydrolysing)
MVVVTPMIDKILIAVTGEPVARVLTTRGDFVSLFKGAIRWRGLWDAVDVRHEALPEVTDATALIVTGSSASVHERAPWMVRTEAWLRDLCAREVPVLGVCFGHQILGQALGGEVRRHPRGREMSTVDVHRLADDPILEGLGTRFRANACHKDTVSALPPGAVVLARNEHDAHQCVRFGKRAWGVQFHPEFDREVMSGYIQARRDEMQAEGMDVGELAERAADTPDARRILENFVAALR